MIGGMKEFDINANMGNSEHIDLLFIDNMINITTIPESKHIQNLMQTSR